jgi:hypothetical protein
MVNICIQHLNVIHTIVNCDDAICWQQQSPFFLRCLYIFSNMNIPSENDVFWQQFEKKEGESCYCCYIEKIFEIEY